MHRSRRLSERCKRLAGSERFLRMRSAQPVQITSAQHVVGEVAYASLPPAGGNHNGCWARWGVHDSELADERFVHNLEHGGVVFSTAVPMAARTKWRRSRPS